jgi:hypothetical protein
MRSRQATLMYYTQTMLLGLGQEGAQSRCHRMFSGVRGYKASMTTQHIARHRRSE